MDLRKLLNVIIIFLCFTLYNLPKNFAQSWDEIAQISPEEDSTIITQYGESLAIDGNIAVVGDTGVVASPIGKAYILEWNGTEWQTIARLTVSDKETDYFFGSSVSISGNTVVVGAPRYDTNGNRDQGKAYVFERPETGWTDMTETAQLTASDGAEFNSFGIAVSISGNSVVVGAPHHNINRNRDQGKAYVFERPEIGWTDMTETAQLTASDGTEHDYFGESISISGNTVVVGAHHHDTNGNGIQGKTYIFEKPAVGWADMTETAQLTSSDGAELDRFGNDVSISGNTVVVGAPDHDTNGNWIQGKAYVFERPAAGWTDMIETAQLTASDGARFNFFGKSVAISVNTVVVGASFHDTNGNNAQGKAYVFERTETGWTDMTETAQLTASDGVALDFFGSAVSISGSTVVVGAPKHDANGYIDQGKVYMFEKKKLVISGIQDTTVTINQPYSFTPAASHEDDNQLTFSITNQPAWATFDINTGQLSGTPASIGTFSDIEICVSDGKEKACLTTFSITVNEIPNNPPKISGTPSTILTVGQVYDFTPTVSDVDNDTLNFSIINQPAWATFDINTGQLSGTPASIGTFSDIEICVSDGKEITCLANFIITVESPPNPIWKEVTQTSPNNNPERRYGKSVAIDANIAVVGYNDNTEESTGKAHILQWNGIEWQTIAILSASDSASGANFGSAISISGNTVIIGAPTFNINENWNQGKVYVYERPETGWADMTETAQLKASDGGPDNEFGSQLSISGNVITVGVPRYDTNGKTWQGKAYLFERPATGWTNMSETAQLTASDGASLDEFGSQISISGNTVVIGAPSHDTNGENRQGKAYVYERPSGGWTDMTETAQLIVSDGLEYDFFGESVSIYGNIVVVGAPMHDTNGNRQQGKAYVFEKPETGWTTMYETAQLIASDGAVFDGFGRVISISSSTVLVGLPFHDMNGNINQGKVYIFMKDTDPMLWGTPSTIVILGQSYDFMPIASSTNEDTLSFSITNQPEWATFDVNTGRLSGTPTSTGNYRNIQICVSNGKETLCLATFTITVDVPPSKKPIISGTPSTVAIVSQAYEFIPTASDEDGDTLSFSITNQPEWSTFDASTGKISGTPNLAGNYRDIEICVSDGKHIVCLSPFTIIVDIPTDNMPTNHTWSKITQISPDEDSTIITHFGMSLALDGNVAAVLVRDSSLVEPSFDKAYILEWNKTEWQSVAVLTATDEDNFGETVSISGNTVVIGAPYHDTNGNQSQGKAYIFEKPVTGWTDMTETAQLTASDGTLLDDFGQSVSISGNTVIIGAPEHGFLDHGKAYLFERPETGWTDMTETAQLIASDGAENDNFGSAVSISGNTVVVGAPEHDTNGYLRQGKAYVFERHETGWIDMTETAQLITSDGAVGNNFGSVVFISGNTIAVGVPYHNTNGNIYQGKAYAFEKPATGWIDMIETVQLTASDGAEYDFFGKSVSIAGNTVVVGSPGHDTNGIRSRGKAYIFERPTTGWIDKTEVDQLTALDGTSGNNFGSAVSISDNSLLVGAPFYNSNGNINQGKVYMFMKNISPILSGIPNTTLTVGQVYDFIPTATDEDGDTLTFSITNKPEWTDFDVNTGQLSGTPSSVGTSSDIEICVSDGKDTTCLASFSITVNEIPNNTPTIAGIPNTIATINQIYDFIPTASDEDGDSLTFSITNQPQWTTFDTHTGQLSGTPISSGTFSDIEICVSDGKDTVCLTTFSITVNEIPNYPPNISGTPNTNLAVGQVYDFIPTASDMDNDTLSFSIVNQPEWVAFDTNTGQMSGIPVSIGTFSDIEICVSDGKESVCLPTFNINVETPLSINNISLGNTTFVYPNPTNNFLHFEMDNELRGDLNIVIYDNIGKRLIEKTLSKKSNLIKESLSLGQTYSGLIYLRIEIGDKIITNKVNKI